jgi:hypothetical protein
MRIPTGSRPSQASIFAALILALWQCRRTWDLVMVTPPAQNQQLSFTCFLILLRYVADLQCAVLIWVAARAIELRAPSMHDFFGAGGGISSFPWCFGFLCHSSLALLKLSDMRSLRWEGEAVGDQATFPAACTASRSVFSFPGIAMCPLAHTIFADLPCRRMSTRIFWIDLAIRCPGSAPECSERAMALWESEWMMRWGWAV